MPGWRDRSSGELSSLINVVQGFSTVVSTSADPAQLAIGSQVYTTHCAECHGEAGQGDGFAVGRLPQPVPPTDFTREQLSVEESLRVLRNGVSGTSMAPWLGRLSEAEMTSVSYYLRSLFKADGNTFEEQTADD
jgi:high-affinity iron transporter